MAALRTARVHDGNREGPARARGPMPGAAFLRHLAPPPGRAQLCDATRQRPSARIVFEARSPVVGKSPVTARRARGARG